MCRLQSLTWDGIGSLYRPVTIEALPDEALLEVFDFYLIDVGFNDKWWIMLAHVWRRWRYLVFASPLRLNLILYCTARKPVREILETWPPLPIVIRGLECVEKGADNIIAALEHNDRVRGIDIHITQVSSSVLGRFARAMQDPFPELTYIEFRSADGALVLPLPEAFLGGSAPHLQSCYLDNLPFSALRKLLLSASHLVTLSLENIPQSVYISPEAMVACLAVTTSLESLYLRFLSPRSRPDRETRRLPPLIRTILPTLTDFRLHGASEYLEDFISQVDAPLLDRVDIILFHQLSLDVSQLHQFIGRTEALSALSIANVGLAGYPSVELSQQGQEFSHPGIKLSMSCSRSDWQLSFLAQACGLLLPTPSTFETLNISENRYRSLTPGWEDDMENGQWLELFHPFTSVKNLYLSKKLALLVAPALQELTEERVTDVLPMLQNLYVEGLQPSVHMTRKGISQFVAARELSNHPVTVEPWDRAEMV
ncbi:hypothetical protein BJV74DRAFT_353413 [Russula compacta]|nr:hypothetical protein BJV74DRAFT_353413 [Russula compacta]